MISSDKPGSVAAAGLEVGREETSKLERAPTSARVRSVLELKVTALQLHVSGIYVHLAREVSRQAPNPWRRHVTGSSHVYELGVFQLNRVAGIKHRQTSERCSKTSQLGWFSQPLANTINSALISVCTLVHLCSTIFVCVHRP